MKKAIRNIAVAALAVLLGLLIMSPSQAQLADVRIKFSDVPHKEQGEFINAITDLTIRSMADDDSVNWEYRNLFLCNPYITIKKTTRNDYAVEYDYWGDGDEVYFHRERTLQFLAEFIVDVFIENPGAIPDREAMHLKMNLILNSSGGYARPTDFINPLDIDKWSWFLRLEEGEDEKERLAYMSITRLVLLRQERGDKPDSTASLIDDRSVNSLSNGDYVMHSHYRGYYAPFFQVAGVIKFDVRSLNRRLLNWLRIYAM